MSVKVSDKRLKALVLGAFEIPYSGDNGGDAMRIVLGEKASVTRAAGVTIKNNVPNRDSTLAISAHRGTPTHTIMVALAKAQDVADAAGVQLPLGGESFDVGTLEAARWDNAILLSEPDVVHRDGAEIGVWSFALINARRV